MKVYYYGEDALTKCIAKRLIIEWAKAHDELQVNCVDLGLRESGRGAIKKMNEVVRLGEVVPVVYVIDADDDCPVEILNQYCSADRDVSFSTLNIAVDEGEAWLLSDKRGISKFLGIRQGDIPAEWFENQELNTPYKTSLCIMKELIPLSKKEKIKSAMTMTSRAKKPPTYNNLWPEYILKQWNIEEAAQNSESLRRAIDRVDRKMEAYYLKGIR